MAFSVSMIFCSTNMAEIQAANFGLQWCMNNNFNNIILELDSKIVVEMIKGSSKPSWKLLYWITSIRDKMAHLNAEVSHCFRKANMTADALSKFGAIEDSSIIFTNTNELPRATRGSYIMDKTGLPNLRIRSHKRV
ncbi:uncharacterized protein LOC142162223 [Nicotiana tabacum]|uniref:Uncharacterized protein LOC142162223 n=1 Tax=Nicotiana tabacum TaxID=4097 RepID=A0AC58RPL3_TOBAC